MRNAAALAFILASVSLSAPVAAKPEVRTLSQELRSLERRFDRLDTNRDEKIDQAELRVDNERIAARDGKPVAKGTGGILGSNNDTDGDGMVSLAEARKAVRDQFALRESNNHGS